MIILILRLVHRWLRSMSCKLWALSISLLGFILRSMWERYGTNVLCRRLHFLFMVRLEQNIGIFVACIPMLRNLFIRYAPRLLGYSPSPPSYDRTPPAGTDESGGTTITTKSSRSGRSGGKIDYDEIIRRYAIPKVGEDEDGGPGGSSGNVTTTTLAVSELGIGKKIMEKADEEMQVRRVRTGEQIE